MTAAVIPSLGLSTTVRARRKEGKKEQRVLSRIYLSTISHARTRTFVESGRKGGGTVKRGRSGEKNGVLRASDFLLSSYNPNVPTTTTFVRRARACYVHDTREERVAVEDFCYLSIHRVKKTVSPVLTANGARGMKSLRQHSPRR